MPGDQPPIHHHHVASVEAPESSGERGSSGELPHRDLTPEGSSVPRLRYFDFLGIVFHGWRWASGCEPGALPFCGKALPNGYPDDTPPIAARSTPISPGDVAEVCIFSHDCATSVTHGIHVPYEYRDEMP